LYDRREAYAVGTCPAGVVFLTAGVDVQKDRLVYEVVGWGRGKRSWSIDAGVLHGETADQDHGPWGQLDALLGRTFRHDVGADLTITTLAIDSGFATNTVYNWARHYPMSRVIAVKGVPGGHVLVGTPSRIDVSVSGKKMRRGYKVWPVAPHVAKAELYGWLALPALTDEQRAAGAEEPPGFCHFPQHGETFFSQLTAEQLITSRTKRGVVFSWEVIPGRENHWLDARVYARAAAAVAGIDRFNEQDWAAMEKAIGVTTVTKAPEIVKSPTSPPQPPAAPSAPRSSWLAPRRDWLKR
jgi:phage terminase large subunit GpA-like protein